MTLSTLLFFALCPFRLPMSMSTSMSKSVSMSMSWNMSVEISTAKFTWTQTRTQTRKLTLTQRWSGHGFYYKTETDMDTVLDGDMAILFYALSLDNFQRLKCCLCWQRFKFNTHVLAQTSTNNLQSYFVNRELLAFIAVNRQLCELLSTRSTDHIRYILKVTC